MATPCARSSTANASLFRAEMGKLGFTLAGAGHPIIPVMLGDASLAQEMAARMLERGVYVIGFSFPVVPKGQARIRTQMSAAHQRRMSTARSLPSTRSGGNWA